MPTAIAESQHATERVAALPFSTAHEEGGALVVTIKQGRRGRGKVVQLPYMSEDTLRAAVASHTPLLALAADDELFWNVAYACNFKMNAMEHWLFM